MRFRWKLSLILLIIALIPTLIIRTFTVRSIEEFERKLVTRTRETLVTDTENRMRMLVDVFNDMMRQARARLETVLNLQVKAVEKALGSGADVPPRVYFTSDFDKKDASPPDTSLSPRHFRTLPEGRRKALAVSLSTQVFQRPPQTDVAGFGVDIARLSAITPALKTLHREVEDLVLWHCVRLANGLESVFPGFGVIPCRPEPDASQQPDTHSGFRGNPWYRTHLDRATGRVVWSVSRSVHGPAGDFAGTTSLVVPLGPILEIGLLVDNLPAATNPLLTLLERNPATGRAGIRVTACAKHSPAEMVRWCAVMETQWLTSSSSRELEAMIRDLAEGKSGLRRMPYQGRDSLWAYGSISRAPGDHPCLILITPHEEIMKPALQAEERIQALLGQTIRVTQNAILGTLAVIVILVILVSRTVTKSMDALQYGATRLAQGDFDYQVAIHTRDEFGHMGRVFNTVGPRLKEHYQMAHSLALAMEVQQSLLPLTVPEVSGLDMAGRSIYCDETGGDYYDFIETPAGNPDEIHIVVGDVSGHGIQSALLMASARAFLRQRISMPGDLARVITDVNRQLSRDVEHSGRFMTMFLSKIDNRNKVIRWVRAGHDPALVYDAESNSFAELSGPGISLGITDTTEFQEFQKEIRPGQTILIGTDGIWECRNRNSCMMGKENIRDILRRNAHRSAEEIVEAVITGVDEFRNAVEQQDDITLVVVKVVS